MLILPDLSRQFIVEVDVSDSGIGAVLFQRLDNRLQIVLFFLLRFPPLR